MAEYEVHLEGTWSIWIGEYDDPESYVDDLRDALRAADKLVVEVESRHEGMATGTFTLDMDIQARNKTDALHEARYQLEQRMESVWCTTPDLELL